MVRVIPRCCIYGFAYILSKVIYILAIKQRRVAFAGLEIAFGDQKTKEERKKIAIECFDVMVKNIIEFLVFINNPDLIDKHARVEGYEYLVKALEKGKGVVALSAHIGNFPLLLVKLARDDYKINSLLRHMRDPWMDEYLYKRRTALGVGSVFTQPRKKCVEESLEVLRKNQILFIQLDQNFGTGGVFVDFFGKKAATAKGPIVLALRAKSPIVPMFIVRENKNMHKIIIEPEVEVVEGRDSEETIQLNAAKLTKLIESYVRKYPSEWGWIHRRWKARPKEERKSN